MSTRDEDFFQCIKAALLEVWGKRSPRQSAHDPVDFFHRASLAELFDILDAPLAHIDPLEAPLEQRCELGTPLNRKEFRLGMNFFKDLFREDSGSRTILDDIPEPIPLKPPDHFFGQVAGAWGNRADLGGVAEEGLEKGGRHCEKGFSSKGKMLYHAMRCPIGEPPATVQAMSPSDSHPPDLQSGKIKPRAAAPRSSVIALSSTGDRQVEAGYLREKGPRQRLPAWAMSTLLHTLVMLSLVFWLDGRRDGQGDGPERAVGIAVAHRLADRTEYEEVTAAKESSSGETDTEQLAPALAAAAAPPALVRPIDLSGLLAEATETPVASSSAANSGAIEAGGAAGNGATRVGEGGGPEATTMFFGVSGSGRKFVYVFDRSDSMNANDGAPLRSAKREILRSLGNLRDAQSFQIIFYNHRASFFQPAGQSFWLLSASDSMKRRAETFVRAIDAFGGTEHFDALKMAIKLEPDVIFFLTDARIPRLNRRQLDEIRGRCQRGGTTIHAIEFGNDLAAPSDSFLQVLAAENGGEYRYLNVDALANEPAAQE